MAAKVPIAPVSAFYFCDDGGADQTPVAVGDGFGHYPVSLGFPSLSGEVFAEAFNQFLLVVNRDPYFQEPFSLSTPHGQITVGGTARQRFVDIEISLEFPGLLHLRLDDTGGYARPALEPVPDLLARAPVLADPFSDYVGGAGDGGVCVLDFSAVSRGFRQRRLMRILASGSRPFSLATWARVRRLGLKGR